MSEPMTDAARIAEGLWLDGIEMQPWQRDLLTAIAKAPKDARVIFVRGGKIQRDLHALRNRTRQSTRRA